MVLRGVVLELWPLKGGPSFCDAVFGSPPLNLKLLPFENEMELKVSNFQDFLVSMISTSLLNKKKIHDIGCTPLGPVQGRRSLYLRFRIDLHAD